MEKFSKPSWRSALPVGSSRFGVLCPAQIFQKCLGTPFTPMLLSLLALATGAGAADELLAKLPPEALADPAARAPALAALKPDGFDAPTRRRLSQLLAEAWLDAGDPAKSTAAAELLLGDPTTPAGERDRAALTWIAAWQARPAAERGDVVERLGKLGPVGLTVQARALTARALSRADQPAALEDLDQALALLKAVEPGERSPLYTLRMTVMEDQGAKPAESAAWLATHADDPAAPVTTTGQLPPAPALVGPRVDPAKGVFDLTTRRNAPVLVAFIASWDKPSQEVPAVLQAALTKHPELQGVVVALDGSDTLPDLPAWIAKQHLTVPVVADGLGWDGELDDAWRVTALPRLFLVNAQGRLVADALWSNADTGLRIEAALAGKPAEAPPAANPAQDKPVQAPVAAPVKPVPAPAPEIP